MALPDKADLALGMRKVEAVKKEVTEKVIAREFEAAFGALEKAHPSSVSLRICNLERSLGVKLFDRRWRYVTPTEQCEQLYLRAKDVIAAMEKVESVVLAL